MDIIGLDELIGLVAQSSYEKYRERFDEIFLALVSITGARFQSLDDFTCQAIAQDTMSKVLEKAKTYNGKTDREAWSWIIKIAKNLALSLIAGEKKYIDYNDHAFENQKSPGNWKDSQTVLRAEQWKKIKSHLTERELQVLELYLVGCKQVEIAEKTGLTKPRVSQIIKSIVLKLRPYFK